jgi:kinesin family member 18/19
MPCILSLFLPAQSLTVLQEKQYTFDRAFHAHATNSDVYSSTIAPLITHALHGINCTVFAYGATGSGKTYTMVGDASDPGLMVRSIEALFMETERFRGEEAVSITASYLEVYNEVGCEYVHVC